MCNFVQLKFFGVQDFCPGSVSFVCTQESIYCYYTFLWEKQRKQRKAWWLKKSGAKVFVNKDAC